MDYSILIPFKTDDGHRESCFDWLLAYYESICPEAEIVVGTADECNRSKMRNDAASNATTDIFIFINADGLVKRETILKAVECVKAGHSLVQPRAVRYLTERTTKRIIQSPFEFPRLGKSDFIKHEVLIGEFFAVSRQTFKKIRGWDESFTGWGGEDDAFKCAIRALVGPFKILDDTVYHLWHERTENETNKYDGWCEQKRKADMYIAARTNPRLMRQIIGICKTDCKEFSILIPFQGGDPHRERIFDWLCRYYRLNFPEAELVIGEDDTKQVNRSRMRNDAFQKASTDILVYIDADGLVKPCDLRAAIDKVKNGAAMVQMETVSWLNKESTFKIIDGKPYWREILPGEIYATERVLGEFFALTRSTHEKVHGWDERFQGWGGEDQAFRYAVMALAGKIEKLPSTVYHIWHPRTVNETPKHKQFKYNRELRDRYVSAENDKKRMLSIIAERTGPQMGKIDFYAPAPHYFDHLEPIYRALSEEYRGQFFIESGIIEYAKKKLRNVLAMSSRSKLIEKLKKNIGLLVVAGIEDVKVATDAGRIPVLVDHGSGQTYIDSKNGSYAGGQKRENVTLFIVPNEWSAKSNRAAYPDTPVEIVGCPKLDRWHNEEPKERSKKPVVCVSFHWSCEISQETRGGFHYFKDVLPELAKSEEFELVGHAHPNLAKFAYPFYHKHRIRILPTFDDVLNEADVYIIDNSSTLYEFADLDRPVVVLNPPWFRRDVHHGLRFWECADVGVNCDKPEDLKDAILKALEDLQEIAQRRREIMKQVYPHKGNSSKLAALAIERRWKELFERRGEMVKARVERAFIHEGRIVRPGEIVEMSNSRAESLEKKRLVTYIPTLEVPENKLAAPPESKPVEPEEPKLEVLEDKKEPIKGYVCDVCDRGFYSLNGLKSHQRQAHPKKKG